MAREIPGPLPGLGGAVGRSAGGVPFVRGDDSATRLEPRDQHREARGLRSEGKETSS
jgi:hypothetical protein